MRAEEIYSEAKRQSGVRNIDVLMNSQSPHKWWYILKSAALARVRHYLRLLVGVEDRFESWLVKLICCHIILTASSPGSLLIYRSHASLLLVLPPLPSGRVRVDVSC